MNLTRRYLLATGGTAVALAATPSMSSFAAAAGATVTFDLVKQKAKALSLQAFDDTVDPLPDALRDLDYSHYRMINFRGDHALWKDQGRFRIQLFHRGFQYNRKVSINLVENGRITPLAYSPDQFDFRGNNFDTNFAPDLGFAGFRIHTPLNHANYFDEFAVFEGASYFRLVGKGQLYGLSGRGLAINTAEPEGEEFPWFREFWLERPARNARTITVYALLDSRSTTGAYRFVLTPDTMTVADVDAVLFPRADIKKLGIAPLTSMYLHGKIDNRPFADIHPEAHDSDGLLIHNGAGESLWRPLQNPRLLRISSFSDTGPRAFGLLQRERNFAAYQDPETGYEQRPDGWVSPKGNWGRGAVQLVEIPSDADSNDNMVAYWVPQAPVKAGQPLAFAYRLTTMAETPRPPMGLASCIATRTGPLHPIDIARDRRSSDRRVMVDFAGPALQKLDQSKMPAADLTSSTGQLSDIHLERLPNAGWRVSFAFQPDASRDAELRLTLRFAGRPVSETWSYRWGGDASTLPA